MENTSTVIGGKDGYPMVVNSGGHGGYGGFGYGFGYNQCNDKNDCLESLITQNTITNGTTSNLEAIHRNTMGVMSAVSDSARDTVQASHNDTNHIIREVSSVGRDNINVSNNNHNSIASTLSDIRSSNERQFGEVRERISDSAKDAAIAAKDIELSVTREAYQTREQSFKQFADLTKQNCDIEAKIAACCAENAKLHCETLRAIAASDTKRVETENANLRQELLLAEINKKGND